MKQLKSALENLLNMKVALIPDPLYSTGHSDGVASFFEDDVFLIADYNNREYYNDVEHAIKTAFPEVETVRLECKHAATNDTNCCEFTSALGSYVNILACYQQRSICTAAWDTRV